MRQFNGLIDNKTTYEKRDMTEMNKRLSMNYGSLNWDRHIQNDEAGLDMCDRLSLSQTKHSSVHRETHDLVQCQKISKRL